MSVNTIIKTYSIEDAERLNFRDVEEYYNLLEMYPDFFIRIPELAKDYSFTFVWNDRPAAIVLLIPQTKHSGEVIFFSDKELENMFDKSLLKAFRSVLNYYKNHFTRLQATCKRDKRNKRFLEFLGFKKEGLMKKSGYNQEDLYIYSIVQ